MAQNAQPRAPQSNRPVIEVLDESKALAVISRAHDQFLSVMKSNPEPLQVQWEREAKNALQLIMKSDQLRKADPSSIVNAVTDIASVGLTLNPIKQHCTIVPRYNSKTGFYEAAYMAMYRGLMYLAGQAGVSDIVAEVVYSADEFSLEHSSQGDIYRHKLDIRKKRGTAENQFYGAYVAARMPESQVIKVEWVPAEDIYKMRERSDSYYLWDDGKKSDRVNPKSGWVVWFDEFAKKSGIKRAQKRWEEAMQDDKRWQNLRRAIELDNRAEGTIIDGTASEVIPEEPLSMEQITKIEAEVGALNLQSPQQFIWMICATYKSKALSEIPAKHYNEIIQRIKAAKEESERRRRSAKGKVAS